MLRNEKDLISEGVFNFRSGRKTSDVDQALIACVRAFHESRLPGDRCAIGIISFGSFCRRGRRIRGRSGWCVGISVFRGWRIRVKRLLGWWSFGGRLGRWIPRCMSVGGRLILGASRHTEREQGCEQEPRFHNFVGRSLHCFYFNASGLRSATHFAKANF